jgi:hypothetical protein
MSELKTNVNIDDMHEITDFKKGRKKTLAEKIKKEGITIRETKYYSPEDIANGNLNYIKDVVHAVIDLLSEAESKTLLAYIKEHYNLPCSPNVWDYLDK